jgi:branched-chain amino acid transport system substrate-binding protein
MNWPNVRSLSAAVLLCPALILAAGDFGAVSLAGSSDARKIEDTKELVVAAIGNWEQTNLPAWQGLELAAKEINQSGGILGKPLHLLRKEAPNDLRQAVKQAQDIADNPDTAMAILYSKRNVALPISIVLAYYDVLTLFTGESTPFHEVNLPLLFRLCPSDSDEMNYLTTFCLHKGLKRVAIFTADSDSAKIHANTFETEARAKNMEIVSRTVCDTDMSQAGLGRELTGLVKKRQFDAIFYSGPAPLAVKIIKAAAAQGIDQPFIGGSQWDTPDLASVADPKRTSVFIATPFAPDLPGNAAQHFIEAYRQAYGEYPDAQAAINYNALYLYAQAARLTGSTTPDRIMNTLYNKFQWDGPIGPVRLNDLGELLFSNLYIKHFVQGHFQTMDLGGSLLPQ